MNPWTREAQAGSAGRGRAGQNGGVARSLHKKTAQLCKIQCLANPGAAFASRSLADLGGNGGFGSLGRGGIYSRQRAYTGRLFPCAKRPMTSGTLHLSGSSGFSGSIGRGDGLAIPSDSHINQPKRNLARTLCLEPFLCPWRATHDHCFR
jgi:hypothetical protein